MIKNKKRCKSERKYIKLEMQYIFYMSKSQRMMQKWGGEHTFLLFWAQIL